MKDWKKYTIEKGHHVSEPTTIGFHVGTYPYRMTRTVMFERSCAYDLGNTDQLDTNKLYGFSHWNHMQTSFRFGWRYDCAKKSIEVMPYIRFFGKEYHNASLFFAEFDYAYETSIFVERGWCTFGFGSAETAVRIPDMSRFRVGYFLRPYFGGNETAPHSMEMYIRK